MIEFEVESLIALIIGVGGAVSIFTAGVMFIFNRGKKAGIDKACGKRIEDKIDAVGEELGEHQEESGQDKKTLHRRIDDTHERINTISTDVAEIKGTQKTMLTILKEKLK